MDKEENINQLTLTDTSNDLIEYQEDETDDDMEIREDDFLNDLYLFYRYFIASNYRNSVPAPHIHELADKLMKLALDDDSNHRLAVSMPPRHPVNDDCPVYTSNKGWITHAELEVGDKVLSVNGGTTEVLKVYPSIDVDNCFEFNNGDKIISGDDHIWRFYNFQENTTELYTSKEIMDETLYYKNNIPNFKIPYKGRLISLIDAYKVPSTKGNCITVDSKDGMYLVGKNLTPTHNSKSSMVTLAFPLWLLFQDPNVNIMIVTGSPKLAEKFGIQLREYVRELGGYFNVYLSTVKQASTHIMFCDKDGKLYRGNIMLASSGGGITGQDADYLILDDPYTGNDSELTPSALQQKIDWVNRVVEQRIEPHTKYPISNDCPVKTINKGWITHGELEVGDVLLTPNGNTTKVLEVLPKTLVDNCFVFSNGDKIISGDHHLWEFHDDENNIIRLFETQEIMKRNTFVGNSNVANFKIYKDNKYISLINKYKVEKTEGNCINVDNPTGMYLIGRNLTPTHNCVLHTRWHSNDIIGYYKETDPDSYEFVEFPAIQEDGTPLWKERYTIEELLKKKENVGERVFESIYQQQPIDMTSDFFNMQHLKFGRPENFTIQASVRAWDIASSEGLSGDFSAGVLMYRYDDYCVISDLIHGRFGGQINQIIKNTAIKDTANVHILIETGVAGAGELLYQEWQKQLTGFIVERAQVSGRGNKADRATPFRNAVEDGKVYIDIEDLELRKILLDEMNGFPALVHDDIIDAIAHCYNYLFMDTTTGKKVNARIEAITLNW